ncbi:MAG: NAD(P)/FAD-dependent oxidoreductase [Erysipelotrichaceae bacterium]|nr:NAD(P)/FAD-dependent oxidoreductase [Erysipelotrichaceae bacterium]
MKTIVIGGGPAGMMASCVRCEFSKVLLFEKNKELGKKLLLTGHGRCNVTNDCDTASFIKKVNSNGRFLTSSLNQFNSQDFISFLHDMKVDTTLEDNHRVFPASQKAETILNAFKQKLSEKNIELHLNEEVLSLIIEDSVCKGIRTKDTVYYADCIILCTGGMSFPSTGSNGSGYELAKQAHHTIVECKPALCALNISQNWVKECMGITVKNVELKQNKLKVKGDLLFTHFGISGPMILNYSSQILRGSIHLDFLPQYTFEQLDELFRNEWNHTKQIQNAMTDLPLKVWSKFLEQCSIPKTVQACQISKNQRRKLVEACKNQIVTVTGPRSFNEAMVTKGGILTKEINPKTMESRICKNLKFAGEIIDVDAQSGGYNLQIAWTTGYAAGKL